jgi:hypothetical protein
MDSAALLRRLEAFAHHKGGELYHLYINIKIAFGSLNHGSIFLISWTGSSSRPSSATRSRSAFATTS